MSYKLAILPGDGIGPEIIAEALRVLELLQQEHGLCIELEQADVGGAAYEAHGHPLPEPTLKIAREADALLLGSVGGPQWETLERALRPEQGLLALRSELSLFSNLRPAFLYPQLAAASTLKPAVVSGLDIMIVRELTGGIYFGQPRGIRTLEDGQQQGFNTLVYSESEIERIGRSAYEIARKRSGKLCSVDKANVLEVSELWRQVITGLAAEYSDVALSHMYVDNAAMQLVRWPKQFDVMLCGNMFGDIISDEAAMLTGSLGMLPSASIAESSFGMYEPSGGSAPDIAGQGIANPIAQILSASMMLRYSFGMVDAADAVDAAVEKTLNQGYRTCDIYQGMAGERKVNTAAMGDAVIANL